jgi:hypothetical protein
MTESSLQLRSAGGDFQRIALDLRCMSGTVSEIANVWRRAGPCRPGLPLGLPLQLEAATHQLARIVDDLAWAGTGSRPDLACPVTEQMSVLERDLAAAKAMTCGAGIPPVGGTGLWERLDAAMHQARARVPAATSRTPAAPNRRENPARGGDLGPVTPGRMALHPAGVETGS